MKVEIVSATRLAEQDFWQKSALGQSLRVHRLDERVVTRFSFENTRGLPDVYNESIDAPHEHDVLLFLHDDIWIHDYFYVDQLIDAVNAFDVVGLAGNRRLTPNQVSWYAAGGTGGPDAGYLSGSIGHGQVPFGRANVFGPVPAECETLDGFFLAAKKATLRSSGLRFDPAFRFHLYDMDFCASARRLGLRLGTCRISVTHQSTGNFDNDAWRLGCEMYQRKWPDIA